MASDGRPGPSWRAGLTASWVDVRDAAAGLLPTAFAVWVADRLLDDLALGRAWAPFAVAALVAVGDAFLRPVLRVVAGRLGAIAALGLGVAAQLALVWLSFTALPGVVVGSLGAAAWTLVVVALVGASTRWLLGVNDSSYLVADLFRRADSASAARGVRGHPGRRPRALVVQVDGLPRRCSARHRVGHAADAGALGPFRQPRAVPCGRRCRRRRPRARPGCCTARRGDPGVPLVREGLRAGWW